MAMHQLDIPPGVEVDLEHLPPVVRVNTCATGWVTLLYESDQEPGPLPAGVIYSELDCEGESLPDVPAGDQIVS